MTSAIWDTAGWGGGRSGGGRQRLRWGTERGRGTRVPTLEITFSPPFSWPHRGPLSLSTQLLRMFFRQQDEIRRLKEELAQKDIRIRQLQLELKNLRNSPKNC